MNDFYNINVEIKAMPLCGNGMSGNGLSGNGLSGNGLCGNGFDANLTEIDFEELIKDFSKV